MRARPRGAGAASLSAPLAGNAILDPGQKEFLRAFVRSPLAGRYYLSGGTALAAFHLEHRLSEPHSGRPVPGPLPEMGSLELRAPLDVTAVREFFLEVARGWVRESLVDDVNGG